MSRSPTGPSGRYGLPRAAPPAGSRSFSRVSGSVEYTIVPIAARVSSTL